MSDNRLGNWLDLLPRPYIDEELGKIATVLQEERKKFTVLPEAGSDLTFKAFRLTPYDKVKVIVIGQDIYHKGAFNGVAFGNGFPHKPANKIQPSLRNILNEVERCYPGSSTDPSLYAWAEQGVLLLNTAHTARYDQAGSHIALWSNFTKMVLLTLAKKDNLVWLLWGNYAQEFDVWIQNPTHKIIKTGHPSPLNRVNPFVGSNCFVDCNKILGSNKINW